MSDPAESPSDAFWDGASSSVQRYRALLDAVGDGIYQLDDEGQFVGVNDALAELTGYSREQLHGEHVSRLFSEADLDRVDSVLAADGETTVAVGVETAGGGAVPCEVHVTATTDGQVGVVRDVSTERRGDDATETPPESITNVIDEADIGVFVLDGEFDVAWADETVEQYFGLDRDAILGQSNREVVTGAMQDRIENAEGFAETVLATYDDNSYVEQFECQITPSEDRESRWLEHYSKPIESGEYAGGRLELYYDITERKRSEGSLQDTEAQFQSLVDAVEEYAIFRLDVDGTVISWNEGAHEIKGYDADEILGEHFSTFYTEPDREAGIPARNLEQARQHGSVEDEGWRLRQDGSQFWANVTITAVHGDDGEHRGFLKVTRDMTDRHRREQELESELEQILGRISDAFYAVDEAFRFTHVNERAEQLLGYSTEQLEDTVMWKVFPDGPGSGLYDQFQRAMESQEPVSFERYLEQFGIWAELNVYPSETGLSVYLHDVTDRKEREQELQRTERRFEAIFEDPNILVGLLAPDGTVRNINQTAMEYIDADLADVRGEAFWETPWWGTDDTVRADVKEWTERAADGEYVDFEADIAGPDGERSISGFFRPVVDDDGEVVSIIVSDRDVTERKDHERELELFRSLLDQSNDTVLVIDPETAGILDVNDTATRQLGYSEAELLGQTIPDIETEIDGRAEWEAFVETLRTEGQTTFDGVHRRKDGSTYPVEVEVTHIELDQEYMLAIARDVTERRERERQLEQSEQRYRTLAEYFPNGLVTLFDHDLRYELAAGQGFDQIPVDQAEVQGKHFSEVWNDETVETLKPVFEAALNGEERSIELSYAGREWVLYAAPITDERGEVFAGMTMALDITERKERERYLEDVKSRLEAATAAGAVGTWEWQIPEDEMIVGEPFAETFGIDPATAREGVSLDRFIEAIHEDDRDRVEREIQTVVENCGEYEAEYRVQNADGEYRWVVARGHVECDDDGDPVRFPGALTDISERKRAELELQQNNEQLEALFEVLPVGVLVAEADGEIVSANDTAEEIWAGDTFDAGSIEEYDQYEAYWADSGERVAAEEMTLARVLDGESVTEPDVFEIEPSTGERRIVEAEGRPIWDENGEVVRGVITLSDVTERRETQRKLRESERRHRTLIESFPDGAVAMFDEDLEYTTIGGQLVDELGVDMDDRVGNSVYELYPDEIVDEVSSYFDAALTGEGNTFNVEFHDRHLQGTTLPVRDGDGDIFAGMLVVQDVTERREYERKLEESNERLEQFAYSASHDLQEPLRMVSSYLQLLEDRYGDVLDEDGEEFLEFAVDGAERMKAMIDGLLAYSRVETRGDPLEPTDLDSVLADVRTDLQLRIGESDAEISSDSLPTVVGDEDQLRQVFQNLLENAIEYSGDAPPQVHIAAERTGEMWRVDVADEGIGIDPDDQERIFEVFQRLHTRSDHEGTGIGLSLSERIVERHGGEIWVESEPGEGATFSFTLPAVEE